MASTMIGSIWILSINVRLQEGRLRPKAEDNAEAKSARRSGNGQIEGQKTRNQLKDRYGVKAQGKGID